MLALRMGRAWSYLPYEGLKQNMLYRDDEGHRCTSGEPMSYLPYEGLKLFLAHLDVIALTLASSHTFPMRD